MFLICWRLIIRQTHHCRQCSLLLIIGDSMLSGLSVIIMSVLVVWWRSLVITTAVLTWCVSPQRLPSLVPVEVLVITTAVLTWCVSLARHAVCMPTETVSFVWQNRMQMTDAACVDAVWADTAYVTILPRLPSSMALLISMPILLPTPNVLPYWYFVYGLVVATIGLPGTRSDTSYTIISRSLVITL